MESFSGTKEVAWGFIGLREYKIFFSLIRWAPQKGQLLTSPLIFIGQLVIGQLCSTQISSVVLAFFSISRRSSFLTRFIPQIEQFPGLSEVKPGCIGQ